MTESNLKTIREALDWCDDNIPREARSALDSLEAELADIQSRAPSFITEYGPEDNEDVCSACRKPVASEPHGAADCVQWTRACESDANAQVNDYLMGENKRLESELTTLRARLAPADSPPCSDLIAALRAGVSSRNDGQIEAAYKAIAELERRSQQPETEAQRDVCWHCKVCLMPPPQHCESCPAPDDCDVEGCEAEGCIDALAKARDAEGGKSPALTCPHCDESVSEDGGVEGPLGNLWHYRCLEAWRESDE